MNKEVKISGICITANEFFKALEMINIVEKRELLAPLQCNTINPHQVYPWQVALQQSLLPFSLMLQNYSISTISEKLFEKLLKKFENIYVCKQNLGLILHCKIFLGFRHNLSTIFRTTQVQH